MSEASHGRGAGGTIVLREQRVVYATLGAQALLGRAGRDLLGRELAELLAPQDRARVLDRHERRLRGEPVPSEYELQLLLPDGTQRTAEAQVSVEGNEVVVQLRDLTAQADRRRRLEGLAALGVSVQRERTEAAIHERMREGLAALELAPVLLRPAGEGIEVVWARLPAAIAGPVTALLKRPLAGLRGPWSPFSREAWTGGAAYADDWVTHAAQFAGQGRADRLAATAAAHGLVRALAVRLDERLGPSGYLVSAGEWIRADDLPAFRLFGAQVAAALDSARDIAEVSSRNVELAALAELGRLAGTSASLGQFLPRALEVVVATAGCQAVGLFAARHASRQLELVEFAGLAQPPPRTIRKASFDSPIGAVVGSRRLEVAHPEALDRATRGWLEGLGLATLAYVPLVARSQALGVMVVAWGARLDAGACRPELLLALGSHLAAAMESNQLLGDLRRRVGDLEAIHALALRVLSAPPGETAALLRETAAAVAGALSARQVIVVLLDEAGVVLAPAAVHGLPVPEGARRLELARSRLALEALRTRVPTWTEDTARDPRSALFGRQDVPAMSVLAAPLAARDTQRGVLLVTDAPGRRFGDADRALASAMGAELALALENAELYAGLKREEEKNIRKSRLEALGELSAVIAHEVRNPVGVIFNSIGSLRRLTGSGGDARTLVDIVGEEADRLNRIVGDLLDFARHAPPQLALDRLEQVVEEAVGVAVAQPPPGLEVVRRLDGPLPEVALDAGQVRQAVLNLVVNAVQAMAGGGRLTVRAFLDGTWAVVEVEDTGPGIAELIRGRVFEPFFTTKATGTGLGLPVVKRIVEGHGGELRLRSGPGGTCFSMRFPIAPGPGPIAAAPGGPTR
jgi:two-component system sensor histidine kinase HydH